MDLVTREEFLEGHNVCQETLTKFVGTIYISLNENVDEPHFLDLLRIFASYSENQTSKNLRKNRFFASLDLFFAIGNF
jgi:hypothetical protein